MPTYVHIIEVTFVIQKIHTYIHIHCTYTHTNIINSYFSYLYGVGYVGILSNMTVVVPLLNGPYTK